MVSMGETDKQITRKLKSRLPEKCHDDIKQVYFNSDSNQGRCVQVPNGATVIRLREIPKSPEQYGFLHHEIFHAVEFLMQRIGVNYDMESSETWAYLIGYLTEQIYKRL